MKKVLFLFCLCLMMAACGNKPKGEQLVQEPATEVPDMHTAETSLDYWGTYKGVFPAADCPGIETTLVLNRDNTFTLRSVYIDRKDATYDEKGVFTLKDNLLTLESEGGQKQYYKVEEGQVRHLDGDKKVITGPLADNYILKQEK